MIVGAMILIHRLSNGTTKAVHARPTDRGPQKNKVRAKIVENLFLFSFLPLLVTSKDTIAVNQTLKDGEVLISKENNFVLGFFSPGHSRYRYLGVWFHKVSELTAVWVANRDSPINGSSGALKLDHHGELVLYADRGQKVAVWSSNVFLDVTVPRVAQLLDSGNLVLVQDGSSSKRILWQSFDYPTNTMMNGMTHGLNRKTGRELFLTSWRSTDDPGTGDYSYKFNTDGPPQFFLHKGTNNYWRSFPWPWRNSASAYHHTYVNNEDGVYLIYHQDESFGIQRVVMDESGLIRNLMWDESGNFWKENWAAPRYWCNSFGNCGSFRKCNAENVKSLECTCLPGYEAEPLGDWDFKNGRGRCIKKRQDSSMVCGQKGGFLKVANAKVPAAAQAVWVNMNTSQMDCEQECTKNILCLAYASVNFTGVGSTCLAWYGQLMETIEFTDEGYDLYICVDALQLAEDTRKSSGSLDMKEILPILIPSAALGWIIIIVIACFWIKKRKKRGTVKNLAKKMDSKSTSLDLYKDSLVAKNHGERRHPELEFFDLETVHAATENFSLANKLGQGGFGSVYKGQLSDGQQVAVKRLSKSSGQGMEEFANEVMLIAKLQHRNLVKLLGCCIEGEEPMLIYEYLPNKSLDLFLFDQTRRSLLDWRKRLDIIVGIARGIMYLHQDSRLRIIHRDLKGSNVLLDAEMNPKISDFGMARIFNDDQNQDKTKRVVGTYGYMSPEYAVFGKFSVKSDVFSFGVILLEIISGKKNTDFCQEDVTSLIGHVWEFWIGNRALEVVDSSLKESYRPREALRCIQIGLLCVQEYASARPTMLDVVLMLNSDMPLPHPKEPAFVFQKSKNDLALSIGEKPNSANLVTISDVLSR